MLLVQPGCAGNRVAMPLGQGCECGLVEGFAAVQELLGTPLGGESINVGSAVLEMNDEPQLHARIRYRKADLMATSEFDGLRHTRMLVDVEYTPDLIVSASTTPFRFSHLVAFGDDRMLYKLERTATEGIDSNENAISVTPPPIR